MTYPKIKTAWKRDEEKPHNMLVGTYATPEFEMLKDINWIWTEKIDGTNIRVMWDGNKVSFGGKTDNAQMFVPLYERLQELFSGETMEQLIEQTFGAEPVILYGEGFGRKIQKGNDYIPEGVDFALFDVKVGDYWLERPDMEEVAQKLGGIQLAPIVGNGTLQEASDFAATPFTSNWGTATSEGIVAKPECELLNRHGERIITKFKLKDFEKLKW